jgi:hypothetical protein
MIFVSVLPESLGDKLVPRHFAHGVEDAKVANATSGKLRADHFFPLSLHRIALKGEAHSFCVAYNSPGARQVGQVLSEVGGGPLSLRLSCRDAARRVSTPGDVSTAR